VGGLFARPDDWDSWPDEHKAAFNAALRAELARLKGRAWEKQARPKQLPPDHLRHSLPDENGFRCGCAAGDAQWRTWLCMSGRGLPGTGKTWLGSNWILSQATAQPGTHWGVAAPTIGDVERTCFTGESGILSVAEPGDIKDYNINKTRVTLSNGSVIQGYSADSAERARGSNLYGCWCDELCLFKYPSFYDEVLQPALRRGDARMLITTTPKRMRLLRQILRKAEDPANHIHITRASSEENPHFSKVRLAELKSNYAGTRLFKQEIEGIFNEDVEGALFTLDMISEARISPADVPESLTRVVVAVDPAQTSGEDADESGVICAADDGCGHAYVLADYSLRGSPEQVMRRAVDAYHVHKADSVVFESQSGGDWLVDALRHVDPGVPWKKVHAMRGKFLRAQPVAMLYEQGRVHHAGTGEDFERLEDQLCALTEDSDRSRAKDDRADALVYAISELRGLSGGSWLGAYAMVKCTCGKVYRDDRVKCPQCGLERDIVDPPERRKGPGAQFRDGGGGTSWADAYAPARRETPFEAQHRALMQVIAMQQGGLTMPGNQPLARLWKRGGYR
jgi:phage terminase large subunit-like protein